MRRCTDVHGLVGKNRLKRLPALGWAIAVALMLPGCGGGGSSSSGSRQNPAPVISSISPSRTPAGSREISLTVTGIGFLSGSVVQWGGSGRTTTFVSSTKLTATITPGDLATAGTGIVTVYNPAPGGGTSGSLNFTIVSVSPLACLTKQLPDAVQNKAYAYALLAGGGISPYTWTVISGSLPAGLSLAADGMISGTSPNVGGDVPSSFAVQVRDDSYQPAMQTQSLGILARSTGLGRNESCDTATPVYNGVIRASISPHGDIDVYSFQGTAGSQVTIQTYAQRLNLYSNSNTTDVFLDSFLELLNSSCDRLAYNDDIDVSTIVDSQINQQLPKTGTYYIRVSDLRADGRPDFIYELHLSGADQ